MKQPTEMNNNNIPVLLLTGYLGSGKTTLVNRILSNRRGIKFAVIVNDIGEVNIDADLIQKGGIVDKKDDSLVALQNGCICCTLKMDLIEQLSDISRMGKFDYIVIEASGICEPAPIAQTIYSIPQLGPKYETEGPMPVLDCIVTVVDALRMQSEFACGDDLTKEHIDEEDIVQIKDGMAEAGKTPSRSTALHYEIYKRNPKVNAIILTQCPSLMGFCTTDAEFNVRTIPESWIFLQDVPKFPFGSQYTDPASVAEVFKKRPCAMLANDSIVVASDSLLNAFDRLEVAEFSAKSLILAAPVGKLHPITDKEVEDLRVAFHVGE